MLKDAIRQFDAATIRVDLTRHDVLDRALYKLERMSEGMELATIQPSTEIIEESIAALRNNVLPKRKTAKLLAMGGMPRIIEAGGDLNLAERFLTLVDEAKSAILLRCLLIGYLRFADHESKLPELLRRYLVKRKQQLPRQWLNRVDQYDLLGTQVGQSLVNLVVGKATQTPKELLAQAGLKRVLEGAGYTRLVFNQVTTVLSQTYDKEKMARFLDWVEIDNGKKILFEGNIAEYTKALLEPFLRKDPPQDERARIHNFLIQHFGDPRLRNQNWNLVAEKYKAVINRWLTEESFELLLQIVNQSNDTQHWRERRKFWGKYIEQGLISEAWVALGPSAASVAGIMKRQGEIASSVVFGCLYRENIDAFHSVIFMKMGDWIISEWTHSGKVRFYNLNQNELAPQLYKQWYRPADIRNDYYASRAFVHNGDWQSSVKSYISSRIGVRPAKSTQRAQEKTLSGMRACARCGRQTWVSNQDANGVCSSCRGIKATYR